MSKTLFIIMLSLLIVAGACAQPVPRSTPLETTPSSTLEVLPFLTQINESNNEKWWITEDPPLPTLTSAIQDEFYVLLSLNGNCEFPCFLGIRPGETTLAEANDLMEKFTQTKSLMLDPIASAETVEVYLGKIETNKDIDLVAWINLHVVEERVARMTFHVSASRGAQSVADDEHLSYYSLRNIFNKYGTPDRVYMYGPKYGSYEMQVVYEDTKFVIDLSGNAKNVSADKYEVCPNLGDGDITEIKIALASPSDRIDVKELIGYPIDNNPTLENATGLSLNNFYNLLIGDQQPACFEVQQ
ncbi:MAG: hypothetical protein LC108_12950, partial [Anaerolineales bacterium]|nr:hypothetical protein [Anaerolineales bacterium]